MFSINQNAPILGIKKSYNNTRKSKIILNFETYKKGHHIDCDNPILLYSTYRIIVVYIPTSSVLYFSLHTGFIIELKFLI